jgi:hypothetical protein
MGAEKLTVDDICAAMPDEFKQDIHPVPFKKLAYGLIPFIFLNAVFMFFTKASPFVALLAMQVLFKLMKTTWLLKKKTKITNREVSAWIEKTYDNSTIPHAKKPSMSTEIYHSLIGEHFKLVLPYFISVAAVVASGLFVSGLWPVSMLIINAVAVDQYFELLMNYENCKPKNIVCSAIKLLAAKKKQ